MAPLYPKSYPSINPATGELNSDVECTPLDAFPKIFNDARKAQEIWAEMSFDQRKEHILRMRDYLIENAEAISRVIAKDTGKTLSDGFQTEVLPSIFATDWYAKKTHRFLKKERVAPSNVLFANKQSYILRMPLGVVGIITPWNYPFAIPWSEIVMALMAGNGVVFKTSEDTPLVGQEIQKVIDAGQLPKGLCRFVMGEGSQVSKAMFENGVNKIFFTGSVRVGKLLMKQGSEYLVPVSLELGGNDAAIILEDANLERAANGVVWAGFQNSGQTCAGVERVYVQESIYEEFMKLVREKTIQLRQGADTGKFDIDVGSMTTVRQLETVRRHVDDALKKGAVITAQTKVKTTKGNFYPATVLENVNHTMAVMMEETFGPLIACMKFKSDDEAISLANDSDLGLTSSVWTMDSERGQFIAKKLETGITTINDHVFTHGLPELPWLGWKNSGIGSTHSHLGLEEMTKPKVVNYDLAPNLNSNLWWFPHRKITFDALIDTPKLIFGSLQERADSLSKIMPKLIRDPLVKEKLFFVLKRTGLRVRKTISEINEMPSDDDN
ncbi:MAG: aldehyde dehydrogenase family protein [SAR324 cluster bacterium]|nr:aldehyde dehydrogenase family protein [SAR324 cluster bacterium]